MTNVLQTGLLVLWSSPLLFLFPHQCGVGWENKYILESSLVCVHSLNIQATYLEDISFIFLHSNIAIPIAKLQVSLE